MPLLDLRDACFVRDGITLLAPFSLSLERGEHRKIAFPTPLAAKCAARIAAGIVRATAGAVFIDGFDPRLQPVQAKRAVGYIGPEILEVPFHGDKYIRYRSALWGVERDRASARATELRASLGRSGADDALVGAMLADPPLLVLECLDPAIVSAVARVAGGAAIFEARVA